MPGTKVQEHGGSDKAMVRCWLGLGGLLDAGLFVPERWKLPLTQAYQPSLPHVRQPPPQPWSCADFADESPTTLGIY